MTRRLLTTCILLWIAFAGTGLALHETCRTAERNHLGWVDLAGYDSEGLLTHCICLPCIMELSVRHPLMGAVLSPVIAIGGTVAERIGEEAGYRVVLCCFAAFGAGGFLLLWLLLTKTGASLPARVSAVTLWLSFAHTWILGGIAESFPVSQLILLGTLLMVAWRVRDVRGPRRAPGREARHGRLARARRASVACCRRTCRGSDDHKRNQADPRLAVGFGRLVVRA